MGGGLGATSLGRLNMDVSNKLFWSINASDNNFISFSFAPSIFTKPLPDYEWIESIVEIKF
ncbi:MAG: hypothetical protein IPH97_17635 [Ignavibacteriales bacterium]|nr:hypothetical protein [Ignavibacteriales bacterium]